MNGFLRIEARHDAAHVHGFLRHPTQHDDVALEAAQGEAFSQLQQLQWEVLVWNVQQRLAWLECCVGVIAVRKTVRDELSKDVSQGIMKSHSSPSTDIRDARCSPFSSLEIEHPLRLDGWRWHKVQIQTRFISQALQHSTNH
jgi:hypothetical protein